MIAPRRVCSFFVGPLMLGVDAAEVHEVVGPRAATRVPLADPVVVGLINLRGHIVVAVDLRRRLGLPPPPAETRAMNVIVRTAGGPLSLVVDAVGDVLDLDGAELDPPPETVPAGLRELLAGTHQLPDRLLLVLQVDRALPGPETGEPRRDALRLP